MFSLQGSLRINEGQGVMVRLKADA